MAEVLPDFNWESALEDARKRGGRPGSGAPRRPPPKPRGSKYDPYLDGRTHLLRYGEDIPSDKIRPHLVTLATRRGKRLRVLVNDEGLIVQALSRDSVLSMDGDPSGIYIAGVGHVP